MGLAGAGASVVIGDLNEEHAGQQARAICELGSKCIACQADVSRKTDIERILETTLAHFGTVDILLNAAGINSSTPFFEIDEAEWTRILDVDLRSVFLACQVVGRAMTEAGRGGPHRGARVRDYEPHAHAPVWSAFRTGRRRFVSRRRTRILVCHRQHLAGGRRVRRDDHLARQALASNLAPYTQLLRW
jgi:NAD(P)-dependent dehydrogenase (short-subunit alcohol dehydrogenase family)